MRGVSGRRGSAGFTLMEVVVSLAVIAVAATIGISMFADSYAVGNELRDRRAALRLAEEILTDMKRDPASYTWPATNDQLQQVEKKTPTLEVAPPSIRATYQIANSRIENQYDDFSWRAYVKLPPNSKTCELTVVVSWVQSGRTRAYTLTSLAPLDIARAAQ